MTCVAISALIVRERKSGSNEPYLVNLLHALNRIESNNEYRLFVTRDNEHLFAGLGHRFTLHRVPFADNKVMRMVIDQLAVPFAAARAGATVLHYPGTIGSLLRRRRLRQVVTIHYDIDDAHSVSVSRARRLYYGLFMRRGLRMADAFIVPSHDFAGKFGRHWNLPQQRIHVVHHGVAMSAAGADHETLARFGLKPGYVLSVTHALPHKNTVRIVEAHAVWNASRAAVVPLVLAGNVSRADVAEWVQRSAARGVDVRQEAIVLTGFVGAGDLNALYRRAVCVALPTLIESSSMPVIEAMAAGCPVIASDIEVHRETGGDAAILVDPNSTAAFVAELERLTTDATWRHEVIERGLRRAAGFSWEECARSTERVYESSERGEA